MSDSDGLLAIRITEAQSQVEVIRLLRAATGLALNEIKSALENGESLAIAKFYGIDHNQTLEDTNSLFNELDSAEIKFELILEGEMKMRQNFMTEMHRWHEIVIGNQMLVDLELGEPSIQTLEWLRTTSSADVFQSTIDLIIDGNEIKVDDKTLEWAKSNRSDA